MYSKVLIALAAATVVLAPSHLAFACGGLFCSGGGGGPQQVNQTAERIVFSQNDDGTVTAIVQIMYEGPSDQFGWVLPVRGIPDVGVSSDAAFTALQQATNPTFTINTSFEACSDFGGRGGGGGGGGGGCGGIGCASDDAYSASGNNVSSDNTSEEFESEQPPVTVIDSGAVGPYDFVVIQVDPMAANRVQLALDWLEMNNYEATSIGPDLLGPYLDEDYNLLAVRLQKSQAAGAIRPLRLTYDGEHPMIPIKLTAVAANEDMGVLVWVLGPSQAIPLNYKALELNDALIDWFQPAASYDQVISAAANEAGGQGFVTEFAQGAGWLAGTVYGPDEVRDWTEIQETDWTENPGSLIDEISLRYGSGGNGIEQVIDLSFPSATAEEKAEILRCGSCAFPGELPADFVPDEFLQAIDDFVIAPLRETQELFDSADFITRLYTNISPDEMTLDPSFAFNPDLDDVLNDQQAEFLLYCAGGWRATVPSGAVVQGSGQMWPFNPGDAAELPATIRVRQMDESGPGEVVRDNTEAIQEALAVYEMRQQALSSSSGAGACASAKVMPDGALLLLVFGFMGVRLRRRIWE